MDGAVSPPIWAWLFRLATAPRAGGSELWAPCSIGDTNAAAGSAFAAPSGAQRRPGATPWLAANLPRHVARAALAPPPLQAAKMSPTRVLLMLLVALMAGEWAAAGRLRGRCGIAATAAAARRRSALRTAGSGGARLAPCTHDTMSFVARACLHCSRPAHPLNALCCSRPAPQSPPFRPPAAAGCWAWARASAAPPMRPAMLARPTSPLPMCSRPTCSRPMCSRPMCSRTRSPVREMLAWEILSGCSESAELQALVFLHSRARQHSLQLAPTSRRWPRRPLAAPSPPADGRLMKTRSLTVYAAPAYATYAAPGEQQLA